MSQRDMVLAVVVGLCIIIIGWMLIAKPFSPKYPASPEGQSENTGIHVFCTNPECGFETKGFKASGHDPNWPKICPKCNKKTLMLARKCPFCGKTTADVVAGDMSPSVKCLHCGKMIPLAPPPSSVLDRMPPPKQ